jgi:hypothetical protein
LAQSFEGIRLLSDALWRLSEQDAHKMVWSRSVNITGKKNGCIPADLAIEHVIKETKKVLKAASPNSSSEHVQDLCAASPAISDLRHHLDDILGLRKQKEKSLEKKQRDVRAVVEIQLKVEAFVPQNRAFEGLMTFSPLEQLDRQRFKARVETSSLRKLRNEKLPTPEMHGNVPSEDQSEDQSEEEAVRDSITFPEN